MSTKPKPLYAQVAEELATQLKAGTSPLQKPVKDNGQPAFIKPVNPFSGKGYSALNALNLALKGLDDPRWMTLKDANFNKFAVKPSEKGTLINFPKTSDIEAVRNASGEKIKDGEGKTQTRTIEFEKPQRAQYHLFNATQMKEFPPLEDFLQKVAVAETLSPVQKAEKVIADSGAVIIHGGDQAYYDKDRDAIFMPEKEQFENETKYLQAAIHQLAHWTGHESRQNRPMEGKFGSLDYGREELRAAVTAMLIGAETGIGNHFPHHAAYSSGWAKTLSDRPFEISRVASDAQKATSLLMGFGRQAEQKMTTAQSQTLNKGDAIPHAGTTYQITSVKGKTVNITKEDTGEKFKAKPEDNIYRHLVEARNNPQTRQQNTTQELHAQEPEIAAGNEQTYKIGR